VCAYIVNFLNDASLALSLVVYKLQISPQAQVQLHGCRIGHACPRQTMIENIFLLQSQGYIFYTIISYA
jgi:hypothetical protein